MARYGAKYPLFAPILAEPDNALPTYQETVTIGRLISAELTITWASGTLYADDALAEQVDEFASGAMAMETDDILDEVAATIYGSTVTDKRVIYATGDNPPYGGLVFYERLMRNGVLFFRGHYFPRVKGQLGNITAQTKADNITFGTSTTNFTVFRCNSDSWHETETFDTEADAKAWCEAQLTSTAG